MLNDSETSPAYKEILPFGQDDIMIAKNTFDTPSLNLEILKHEIV